MIYNAGTMDLLIVYTWTLSQYSVQSSVRSLKLNLNLIVLFSPSL